MRHTDEMCHKQCEANGQRRDERRAALFDSEHDDSHDKLCGQDNLEK